MTQQDPDPRRVDVARVEAAAKSLYRGDLSWERLHPAQQRAYRQQATAALQAADKAAEDAKPDPRVEVLAKALFKSMYPKMKWKRTAPRRQEAYRRWATDGLAALDKEAQRVAAAVLPRERGPLMKSAAALRAEKA